LQNNKIFGFNSLFSVEKPILKALLHFSRNFAKEVDINHMHSSYLPHFDKTQTAETIRHDLTSQDITSE
jgi:hypothetical protein